MTKPYPFKSPYDPANNYLTIDYSMNSPLEQDGSNYPCKGYNSLFDTTPSKDTLTAGQTYSVSIGGTAAHNGGSCQISLSYDQGKTFAVIHSMIGGCPLTNEYEFMVPASTPAADKILLSWSWINHSGNREFYQNCSPVKVVNSNSNAVLRAPTLFRANSFADGTCISPEGLDVVYPNPGASVVYGGAYASDQPTSASILPNCVHNQLQTVTIDSAGVTSVQGGATQEGEEDTLPAPTSSSTLTDESATTKVVPSSVPSSAASSKSRPVNSFTEEDSFTTKHASEVFSTVSQPMPTSTMTEEDTFTTSKESSEVLSATSKPVPTNVITEEDTFTTKEASEVFSLPGKVQVTTEVMESSTTMRFVTSTSTSAPGSEETSLPAPQYSPPSPPASAPPAGSDEEGELSNNPPINAVPAVVAPSPIATSDKAQGGCKDNTLKCTHKGYKFETCSNNRWIAMGSVAAGTVCRHGHIVMDVPEEACTDSAIKCTSNVTWSLCANSQYIPMGSVAAGTQCLDGKIVALPASGLMRKRRLHKQRSHSRNRALHYRESKEVLC